MAPFVAQTMAVRSEVCHHYPAIGIATPYLTLKFIPYNEKVWLRLKFGDWSLLQNELNGRECVCLPKVNPWYENRLSAKIKPSVPLYDSIIITTVILRFVAIMIAAMIVTTSNLHFIPGYITFSPSLATIMVVNEKGQLEKWQCQR